MFLISLKAGGTGLNLTAADTVIHYDPWWNPAVEAQATDRAHRIGQDKPVFVYKLIAKDTVEEQMVQLQADKHALASGLYTEGAGARLSGPPRYRGAVRTVTTLDTSLQAQVDAQLLEQGAFAPLELLFNSGRLLYSDYESWRRREIEFLDGALMGNPDKIKAEIEQAISYARRIKLVEQAQEFHAWHQNTPANDTSSDRPLRISMDPQLQRLIGSRYVRAQSVPQMDLFFDNPVVALTNGIVQALTTRNLSSAQRQLDQLYAQAPTHSDLAAFDQLLAALGHLGHPVEEPRQELAFLLEVTPTARRLLGAQSRDLLSPLWVQLEMPSEAHLSTRMSRPSIAASLCARPRTGRRRATAC